MIKEVSPKKRNGLAFFLTALLALSLTACGASELAAQQAEVVLPEPDIRDIGSRTYTLVDIGAQS